VQRTFGPKADDPAAQRDPLHRCGGVLDCSARIRFEFCFCREQTPQTNPEQGAAKRSGGLMRNVAVRRLFLSFGGRTPTQPSVTRAREQPNSRKFERSIQQRDQTSSGSQRARFADQR
jgi:hypothetical protein